MGTTYCHPPESNRECPAVTWCDGPPDGEHVRLGAGRSLDTAKDSAERVAGLEPDSPLVPGVG